MALWNDLEELLPPYTSGKTGKDLVGLISLVDRAFRRAYKLHKAYSSAMRFHCVARWIDRLRNALGQDKNEGWRQILKSLVQSEPGTYSLDNDGITVTRSAEKTKDVEYELTSPKASRKKTATATLFS